MLSAVLAGVKDIRDAVELAREHRRQGRATVVFVDEVHRFNKAQQDAFLPHVESGLFTFIGATTENPSFEVNSALLSRATVHVLKALNDDEQSALLDRAQAALAAPPLVPAARQRLIGHADGDARRLLNAYENLVAASPGATVLDEAALERALGELLRRYDKGGDQFYDTISALHKSVRGSDPDAALYWLARMLDGGADPRYAARRIVRMAARTSAWPTRVRCAWRWTPPRSSSAWARPKASWRWPRPWSTWPWRRSPTPSTPPGTPCAPS